MQGVAGSNSNVDSDNGDHPPPLVGSDIEDDPPPLSGFYLDSDSDDVLLPSGSKSVASMPTHVMSIVVVRLMSRSRVLIRKALCDAPSWFGHSAIVCLVGWLVVGVCFCMSWVVCLYRCAGTSHAQDTEPMFPTILTSMSAFV